MAPVIAQWYVVPVNPEPWKVGPLEVRRFGGKTRASIGQEAASVAFKEAVAEHLQSLNVEILPGPYMLHFFWWRQRVTYQGPKRKVTKKHADSTNMQKLAEDAMRKILITDDDEVVKVTSEIVEQDKEAAGFFAFIIVAGLPGDRTGLRKPSIPLPAAMEAEIEKTEQELTKWRDHED